MGDCCMRSSSTSTGAKKQWHCIKTRLDLESPVPSDIEVARSVKGQPISKICNAIGVNKFDQYGEYKAKVLDQIAQSDASSPNRGNYVIVTGMTPTNFGEGKSTTTLGLVQALTGHMGLNAIACIRQPSQGPTFGLKGGAAGGGYSQVWPMDEFNLHLTGDIHAVTAANNLIAAAIDARMFHESTQKDEDLFRRLVEKPEGNKKLSFNPIQRKRLEKLSFDVNCNPEDLNEEQKRKFARLDINPDTITLNRVIDTNDRFLRQITIGQAPTEKNRSRVTKFTISVASELMAILALATDFEDVCERVGRMVIGFSKPANSDDSASKQVLPVTCDDLCITGAVCALLKDSSYPTIMQTLEGGPVLVHCGPFANVAHGNSSIIADKLALNLVGSEGFVVTEAGFASDVGFEKFMDIKCRYSKLMPDCAVLVTTIRALKSHGRDLDSKANDQEALEKGLVNLNAHIHNITKNFQVPVVVALNKFTADTHQDLEFVKLKSIEAGASDCQVCSNWTHGGRGAVELATSVQRVCVKTRSLTSEADKPRLLYSNDCGLSIEQKIHLIATKVYCAKDVSIPDNVRDKMKLLEENGFGHLPICIAKTALSISHDPKLRGAPSGYTFPIVNIEVSAGAGFLYALAAEISTMPGLPTRPAFFDITTDPKTGRIDGLF